MTEAELRALRLRRAAGEPIRSLAECFEIPAEQVIRLTLRANGNQPPYPQPNREIKPEEVAYYMERIRRGQRKLSIAADLNVSEARLMAAVRQHA